MMNQDIELQILGVDSQRNGVSIGRTVVAADSDVRSQFRLRYEERGINTFLKRFYPVGMQGEVELLEMHLARLKKSGALARTEVYFGVYGDPFHPFDEKFHVSLRFLDLLSRYQPGRLVIQTRSPLIVLAAPVLERLKRCCIVSMGIETLNQEVAIELTPDLPQVSERLATMRTLRNFGLKVGVQMAPILPYGNWREDAAAVAQILNHEADLIWVEGMINSLQHREKLIAKLPLARKMHLKRYFHWLRPDSAAPLVAALRASCPEKLAMPERSFLIDRQLSLFSDQHRALVS